MKRLGSSLALVFLLLANPTLSQWQRVEVDGEQYCERETGERIPTEYQSASYSASRCSSFNIFEAWLKTSQAQIVYPSDASAGVTIEAPVGGGDSVSTFTALHKGDSTGTLEEQSATAVDITGQGLWDHEPDIAYQTCADTGDCQVSALIPVSSNWTGSIGTYTGFGVGISEGTADGDYFAQTWVIPQGSARWKRGTPTPTPTEEVSTSGHSALYLAVTYDQSESELKSWYSTDGSNWTQIGSTVTKTLSCTGNNCIAYVFGTSADSSNATMASLTNIDITTTLSITSPGSVQPATIFISDTGNDTTGDGSAMSPWATPSKAFTEAGAGDIIEAQKNGTGTWTFTANTTITNDGISGSPITFRVRDGDTFNAFSNSTGHVFFLNAASFIRFDGTVGTLVIADESNWSSTNCGTISGYPNTQAIRVIGGEGQEFSGVQVGGGTDSNPRFFAEGDNLKLENITIGGDGRLSVRGGNGIDIRGWGDALIDGLTAEAPAGAHNVIQMTAGGPYGVRNAYIMNDWSAVTTCDYAYRPVDISPAQDQTYSGTNQPALVENFVIRDSDDNPDSLTPVMNLRGRRLIVRYGYFLDTEAGQGPLFTEDFGVSANNRNEVHRIYNLTMVNVANFSRLTAATSQGLNNMADRKFANIICKDCYAKVNDVSAFRHEDRAISWWFGSGSINLQGYDDCFLGAVFDGNMFDFDVFQVFVSDDSTTCNGGSTGTEVANLAAAITQWPSVFLSTNNTNAATFSSEANARAATTLAGVAAGLALSGGSNGEDEAVPLATISSGSSGTTLTMSDSAWIYDGFIQGDENNRDWIAVYDSDGCGSGSLKGIRRVVANSVNAAFTTVDIENAVTVVMGDTVFPVLADGTTVACNVGAAQ